MSEQQEQVLDLVYHGSNVFMMGAGGVGKSYCIKQIRDWAKTNNKKIAITATTGTAAFLIGGVTIHSYTGIGVPGPKATPQTIANTIQKKRKDICNKLKTLDILVIDEISMLNNVLFQFISDYLKNIRNSDLPYGGVQLVLSGDLYQLPPCEGSYMFIANDWDNLDIKVVELTKSFRHKDDQQYAEMLAQLRIGNCTESMIDKIKATSDRKMKGATYLFTTNADVDAINKEQFEKLVNKTGCVPFVYKNRNVNCAFAKQGKVPESVELCVGAQVMLTYNVSTEAGLVNGAKGIIKDMNNEKITVQFLHGLISEIGYITVTCEETKEFVEFIPLRLSYAITINKSQGMTLDKAIITYNPKGKDYGKLYTALSRVRSLDTLSFRGTISPKYFQVHPQISEFGSAKSI